MENLSGWSRTPVLTQQFGTDVTRVNQYRDFEARFNDGLRSVAQSLLQTKPDLRLITVDLYSRPNEVLANPAQFGFTVTTTDALEDPSLTEKAFDGPGADYVFWDHLGHFTTKMQALIAQWHLETLTNTVLERLEVKVEAGSPIVRMNHLQIGRNYTLQHSPDLVHWQDAQSFTAAAGTNQWSAAAEVSMSSFYRLTWER